MGISPRVVAYDGASWADLGPAVGGTLADHPNAEGQQQLAESWALALDRQCGPASG